MRRNLRSHAQRPPQMEGISPKVPHSRGLLDGLWLLTLLMELGGECLVDALAESLLDKAARIAAFTAHETLGLHAGLAGRRDGDLDGLQCGRQAAPPIWTVSLIDPSASDCSVIVCPRLWASMRAFSTAYACMN